MMDSEIQRSWKLTRDVLETRLQNQALYPVEICVQPLCFVCTDKFYEAWKESRHSLEMHLIFARTAFSIRVLLYLCPERF